ncbi:MAG: DNA polymerase III, partial [Thaumarchaeota archaeon]
MPIRISEVSNMRGIGPKTIKVLYEKLKITSIDELEKAAVEGRIAVLKGFSGVKEKNILKVIQLSKQQTGRYLLGDVYPIIKKIESRLTNEGGVIHCAVVGSF